MPAWTRTLAAMAAFASLGFVAPAAEGARAWREPIELSAPGADAWIGKVVPALSTMPNGTAVAAWREQTGDDTSAVKVLEKPANGPPLGPQTLGGGANPPSVATTLDGRAYVAWVGTTGNERMGETVLVAERLEGGGYGTPHALATGAEWSVQPGTAVAANASGDAVVLFTNGRWEDQQLWTARRTRDGQWHEPQPVAEPIGEAVWRLHAGMSETGEATFAWMSYDYDQSRATAWTAIEPPDGPAHDVRRMRSGDNVSTLPSLAVDHLGNALVSWTELGSEDSMAGGVYAAVRAPGQPFGEPIDLGGAASEWDPTVALLSDDGHAIVTWQAVYRNGDSGATLSGAVAAVGSVPAGVFLPPERVSSSYLIDTPLTAAVDPLGNAAFFWVDWDTGEQRVVRRSVAGVYGRERAVVACPRTRTYPIASAVDPLGNASLLWTQTNFNAVAQGMRLSQDEPSDTFSPDPCPPPPSPLTWTPKDPAPGDSVTFDASGFRDPEAASNTFKWDLDNDGDFETDSGEDPTATHVFAEPGEHRIVLQVRQDSHNPGNWGASTCPYVIRVGSPPEPPNEYPAYSADPRPPDDPDENPWPVAPAPVEVPPVPPIPELPIVPGVEPPSTTLLDPPGGGGAGVTVQPQRTGPAGLVVEAASSIPGRALLRRGMLVRLTSGRALKVRLRLFAKGRSFTAPVTVRVPKRRAVVARLVPSRSGRRFLRRGHLRTLKLEALGNGRTRVVQRVRLR